MVTGRVVITGPRCTFVRCLLVYESRRYVVAPQSTQGDLGSLELLLKSRENMAAADLPRERVVVLSDAKN